MKRIFFPVIILFTTFVWLTAQNHQFRIATFNIQNLGQSKLAKRDITDTLATIVRQFDVVAVQEVSDVSNQTAKAFLQIINSTGMRYGMACSRRTGVQENDRSSREQYAFYYNKKTVQLLDTALYNDSAYDYFQREPWLGKFRRRSDSLEFVLCTIHTMPERAVAEIDALARVAEWVPVRFGVQAQLIICGDFNASCSYASVRDLDSLNIRKQPYHWIIPDSAKTNLSRKTCAYDRFVVTGGIAPLVDGWEVFRYFTSKKVSDHWPVYISLRRRD